MDAEREAIINLALEQTGGKITEAAHVLGCNPRQLRDAIRDNKSLFARWSPSRVTPPADATVIHRPPADIPPMTADEEEVLPEEADVAALLEKEDAAVKAGLENMGLPPDAAKLALTCQKQQRHHFRSTVESMGGGINRQFWIVQAEVDKINTSLDGELTPQEKFMLREDRRALLLILKDFHNSVLDGMLTQAKVHQIVNGKKKGAKRPKGILDLDDQ